MLAGFLGLSLVLAVIPAVAFGIAGIPVWRVVLVFGGGLAITLWFVFVATRIIKEAAWARWAGVASFGLSAVILTAFTIARVTDPSAGHGAGYILLGGLMLVPMCLAGVLLLLLPQRS